MLTTTALLNDEGEDREDLPQLQRVAYCSFGVGKRVKRKTQREEVVDMEHVGFLMISDDHAAC